MPNLPKNFLLKVVKFNTFILAVSSFLVSIFLPNAALAQSSDEIGHQVSGTDIIIPSTDFKSGDVINGELVLQNKDTRPSNDWIYRASITEDNEGGPGDIINSVLYKDVISIPGNQETKLNFSIPLLTTLPTGTYGLEVELLTASVANPGPFFYKQIKVTGSGAGFLTIKKLALVANDVEEPPTVGLPHKASDTLKARMEIENKNQSAITATPEFKIYIRQSHKEPFQVVSTSETVFPGNSTKTVDLDIPALPEGNSYWGEAIFKTEDQQVAKIAPFRIVISGTSAKIIRVTTDKTEYKKGETVKVLVEYTGPVEDYPTGDLGSGDLQVKIKSGFRQIGSGEATIDLNQAGSAEINIPASASFKNSEIEVTILKDSKVLDQFISKQNGGNNLVDLATSNLVPILGVLGVASVVLVGVLLRKRKKLFWTFLGLVFLSSALFVGGFKVKEVFANHCFITCSQQQTDLSDSRAGHGVNPLVHEWNGPSRDSLWRPGERPNFGGRMLQNGCGNTFGAPGYGLPNRTTFRIQYNTLAWNVRGGDVLGTQTDGSTARSYVGWFWNGWSVPNNIPQKEALLQAEPEGYNLQGSPQHYDRLLLSERVFFGPARPGSLAVSGQPACSNTAYSQITFTWGEVAPQITDGFWIDISESSSFSSFSNKNVGSCAFCSTSGSGGWSGPLASGGNLQLQPGRTYYWRVYAYNDKPGSGIYSSTANFSSSPTCGGGSPPPPPPVGPPPPPVGPPPPPPPPGGGGLPDYVIRNNSGATVPPITVSGASISGNTVTTTVGTAVTFNFRTVNVGSVNATSSSRTAIEAFGSTTSFRHDSIGALVSGTFSSHSFTTTWNTANTYSMLFRADAFGDVAEGPTGEGNNDVVLQVIVNPVAPSKPDLDPNSVIPLDAATLTPVSSIVEDQQLVFRATVNNSGTAGSPVGAGRFCVYDSSVADPFTLTDCYSFSPTVSVIRPGSMPAIAPGGNTTVTSTIPWFAVTGTWKFTFCADPPAPAGVIDESDENNNCHTQPATFTVNPDTSWLQTTRGDVGSQGKYGDLDKTSGQNFAEYLVVANAGKTISASLSTAKSWLIPSSGVSSYSLTLPGVGSYSQMETEFSGGATSLTPLASNPLTRNPGIYKYSSGFTWNGGYVGSCSSSSNLLIFVDGDLILGNSNPVLDFGCPTVLVVNGEIRVHGSVNTINAFLISQKRFVSVDSGPNDVRLIVNGGIISSLDGTSSPPNFDGRRYTDGLNRSAVQINFKPEYLWTLRNILGVVKTSYEETNP